MVDSVRGNYAYVPAADAAGATLPLRILVVGSFYPQETVPPDVYPDPVSVPADVNQLLSQKPVVLQRVVPWGLTPGGVPVTLTFSSLHDFSIESFAKQVPEIRQGLALRERLTRKMGPSEQTESDDDPPFFRPWLEERRDSPACVVVAQLDALIGDLLQALSGDPWLIRLEASWLGLDLLVRSRAPGCQVALLSLPEGCLETDLCAARDVRDTPLYECVYSRAYGQFGGVPFAAVLMDRPLCETDSDSDFLQRLAALGAMIHAPVFLQPTPPFLGLSGWDELLITGGPCPVTPRLARELGSELSQYLVFAAPAIVLRPRRSLAEGGCSHPLFEEVSGRLMLGNPVYAVGKVLFGSAARAGSFTDITGYPATRVDSLLPLVRFDGAVMFAPVEMRFPPATVSVLLRSGISALTLQSEVPFFPHLVSLASTLTDDDAPDSDQQRLSYLFMVLRMAHCLKVVGREVIGSNASLSEVDATLSKWLRQFVSDVEHPAMALKARRPLRQASVRVTEAPGRPGVFAITLTMIPHSHQAAVAGALSVSLLVGG